MLDIEKNLNTKQLNKIKDVEIINIDKRLCTVLDYNIKLKTILEIKIRFKPLNSKSHKQI